MTMTSCQVCGCRMRELTAHVTQENEAICHACADDMALPCHCCGESHHMWNMTCTSQDETYCETCATAYN